MQFKYPELLWALFLLLIPVFIHLFQLHRFKRTPFTNVKLLQKVVAKSQKSKNLKKWLLLATRLLLFFSLIVAFAQPFLANEDALKEKETVIYLDNSFSMQAKSTEGDLLNLAVQDLVKSIPSDKVFTLFTNNTEYRNVTLSEVQNNLLSLSNSTKQLSLDEITIKAEHFFSKEKNITHNLILVSDFQERMGFVTNDSVVSMQKHFVQKKPEYVHNIVIDSVFFNESKTENIEITALLSTNYEIQNTPISLYNGDKLIAKTSVVFEGMKGSVQFTLPINETVRGRLEVADRGLDYDNQFYFSIDKKNKARVLCIGNENSGFLSKIYTEDEFVFTNHNLQNLNYQLIDTQNFIILNELNELPNSLVKSLVSFTLNGGNLLIIPAKTSILSSYNNLLEQLSVGSFAPLITKELVVDRIAFSHQLYKNVFEQKVNNFQYPKVESYFKPKTILPHILSYQNNAPFLFGNDSIYVFSAAISNPNSNFKQSPLIVPTLYKMGANSLKSSALYYGIKGNVEVDIAQKLTKDEILKITKGPYEFIPQQQSYANKVRLRFYDTPDIDGNYLISSNSKVSKTISFNYPRDESELNYLNLNTIKSSSKQNAVSSLFENLQNDNSITALWKWFVILAILFILAEALIIKLLK